MADVIDDPNDPRLANTPLNEGFDPEAYYNSGGANVTTATPPPQQAAPDTGFDPQTYTKTKGEQVTSSDSEYKQRLINKIQRGETDYTYGPGSPGATAADMRQKIGARDNPLSTGDIALPQADYNLFNEEERKKYRIADTSWIKPGQPTPSGSVERYFGPEATGFDWHTYVHTKGEQAVPDIHAYLGPAPADTGEAGTAEEPTPAERIGGAISKAASKFGEAMMNRPIPQFTTPQSQLTPIPQVPAPQMQVIPGQGMIGAAIPTALLPQAQPLPTPGPPSLMPYNERPVPGQFFHNLGLAVRDAGGELKQMVNAPVELTQQAMNPQLSIPSRLAAAAGVVASAAQLDPLLPRGASMREVPVPESLQPKGPTESDLKYAPPQQPQGLPVKAASVQGLKNPPTVRLYHGGGGAGAGTDFTPHRSYAQNYADKTPGGKVWYVDVPKGLFNTHDEYGIPITGVKLPPEWMAKARLLNSGTVPPTPPQNPPPGGGGKPPPFGPAESGEPPIEPPGSVAIAQAKTGNLFSKISKAFTSFRDIFTTEPLPNLRRAKIRDSGYEHASSRNAILPMARDLLSRVFPEQYKNPAAMQVTGDILVKDNVLGIYDQIRSELQNPKISDIERQRLYQNMRDIEQSVPVNQYDADVRAAVQDPQIAANLARWKQFVNPEMERMYRELRNDDPNIQPEPRGRYSGARVNLLSKAGEERIAEMLDHTKAMPESNYSNYRNPNVKPDPFAHRASGTGNYSNDPLAMLMNSLGQRYVESTKLAFYKDIVATGNGVLVEPGASRPLNSEGMVRMPVRMPETDPKSGQTRSVEKSLWVKKDIADEVRQVLNVDKLGGNNPLFQWTTGLQLMQGVDITAHMKNIHTVIANSIAGINPGLELARRFPGVSSADAVVRMANVVKEVQSDSPAIRAELADMAKRGELRPDFPSTGVGPITVGQNAIHIADTSARVIMKRFWENNVQRGRVVDTADARRQFINQIGEYNQRVMNDYQRRVRALGLSPFVVAGRSFNKFSRRLVFGSIGFKPANMGQAVLLRSLNVSSLAIATAIPAILNYIITGKPGGRSGVPIGAVDTGRSDDKGNPIVVDEFQLLGIRRGLRGTGAEAVIEGMRKGQLAGQIANQAVRDVISTSLYPWYGPGLQATIGVVTGKRLDLRGGEAYPITKKVEPGEGIQMLENAKATLKETNPLMYSLIAPVFGESTRQTPSPTWMHDPVGAVKGVGQELLSPIERTVGVRPLTRLEVGGSDGSGGFGRSSGRGSSRGRRRGR